MDNDKNLFLAGAAQEDITPAVGTLLYGYNPHNPSTSVHDPLQLTAVAFRQGELSAMLVAITVGSLQTELASELREKAGEAAGIPAAHVIVSATHTHSGPNTAGFEGWGNVDRPYVDGILLPALLRAARRAAGALAPAEIAVGECRSEVGINRRQQMPDGTIILGQNPWGTYDPTMTCLALRRADTHEGIVNMIHYGCHGTAAGCNKEISRDWSGIMTDRLAKETGVITAFWNGAEGDVGPRLTNGMTTGDIRHVEELGGVAAADAMRAYRACGGYKPGRLAVAVGEVALPYKPLLPREKARAGIARWADPDALCNIARLEYAHYRAVEDEYLAGCPAHDTHFRYPQTIVSLGDAAFVPFPFEMFSEISLRLRAYAPVRYALALAVTNGYHAYLPSQDQICRGGYEVECFLYSAAYTLADDTDQHILDENLRLMQQLGQ